MIFSSRGSWIRINGLAFFFSLFVVSGDMVAVDAPPLEIRVATYNIGFLSVRSLETGKRYEHLKRVLLELDADVIGLQEIQDRQALQRLFPDEQWLIIIDDDSNDSQDLALVVKKPLRVQGYDPDLDADDRHFLFPEKSKDYLFPNRRDVLLAEVVLPEEKGSFFVVVHHAKSRREGRHKTEQRRVGASREMVKILGEKSREKSIFLIGDFNDNPDDRSVNILESGDPNATFGSNAFNKPIFHNLGEELIQQEKVSLGINPGNIRDGRVEVEVPGSRERNLQWIGKDLHTGPQLFDQILITQDLIGRYRKGSADVLGIPEAVTGTREDRASDHLPVYADFLFK